MNFRSNGILAFIPQNQSEKEILNQTLFFQRKLNVRAFILRILKGNSFFSLCSKSRTELLKIPDIQKLSDFIEETLQKEIPNEIIPRIQNGRILKTLVNESKIGGYNFILLDKKESNLKKKDINKLVSRTFCPVLLIDKNYPVKKIKKIVIPVDISQSTQKKLLWATFFARLFQAEIHIVSAININIDETQSLAYKNAEKIKKMLNEREVDCHIKILKAHNQKNHKVILDYIEKENPDLVLIRTHQESLFVDTRIGYFVSEIIHGCKMPVFIVGHSNMPAPLELM
jgi:nucleotide-binding universal stress UspA family protein